MQKISDEITGEDQEAGIKKRPILHTCSTIHEVIDVS